jgi:predicted metal-binding membrane protein
MLVRAGTGRERVHDLVTAFDWLQARPRLLGDETLAPAGLYQLTPVKRRCLTACRMPRGFVYPHWSGGHPAGDALRIGLAYGRSCVGCCWVVMAAASAAPAWPGCSASAC